MGHFKEIEIGLINIFVADMIWGRIKFEKGWKYKQYEIFI